MIKLIVFVMSLWTFALAGGCTTMKRVDVGNATLADVIRKGDIVKVGAKLQLATESGVQVSGKVTGIADDAMTVAGTDGTSTVVPLDDIKSVKSEQFDMAKTTTGVAIAYSAISLIGLVILIGATGATLSF